MTYLFIVNPIAGKNNGEKAIPIINEVMRKNELAFSIQLTTKPGEAKLMAKEAVKSPVDVIIAVGGDGTVNEVVNGMVNSNKILGIVPAGTGNDLARTLKLPLAARNAIEYIILGNHFNIDLGRINGEYFINFASVGLDALIAEEANKIKKVMSNKYSYVLSVLKGLTIFKSIKITIKIDERAFEKDIMLVAVSNGIYYGGGMKIAPNAKIDDGYFDVCIVKRMSKLKLLLLFPSIFKGNHIKYPEVEIYKGKSVEIQAKEDIRVNADGEVVYHRPIHFKIFKNALKVIGEIRE